MNVEPDLNQETLIDKEKEEVKEPRFWSKLQMPKGIKGILIKVGALLLVFLLVTALLLEVYLLRIQPKEFALKAPGDAVYINFLLIGTDAGLLAGGGTMPGRSDVLMLVSFQRATNEVTLLSIPRDTLTYYDGIGYNRINAAHVFGGSEMVISKVEELLQTDIHYYAKVNFQGFKTLVDSIGGVSLYVEKDMNYYDPFDVPPLVIDLKEGFQHLDGDKAEQYVRFRDEMGDIGRVERQQNFVNSFFKQLIKPTTWFRLPLVALKMQNFLESNLHLNKGVSFTLRFVFSKNIYKTLLPGYGEYFDGASYWVSSGFNLTEVWDQVKSIN